MPFHQNRYTSQRFTARANEVAAVAGAGAEVAAKAEVGAGGAGVVVVVVVAAASIVNASLNRKMHAKNLRHCQHRH